MDFYDRYVELCNERGKSPSAVAIEIGLAKPTVNRWKNGSIPTDATSAKIANYFGVSVGYLLGNEKKPLSDAEGITKAKKIPVLGNVAAGLPISAVENILDYEEISEDMARTGEFFGLRIKGNSMEPRIKEGDVVIVKQQDDVESGQVAIVLINGDDATCKKFVKHDNGISLVSYNPAYSPMFFTPEEIKTKPIRIIGRVVELRGKF
ncbi:MAG: helix-turn-helix domain-containing protein [Oscillospiraceae bacterium]|nr:helix-turn-helix domain-containing protein [Oscillospiraceae bacterium]